MVLYLAYHKLLTLPTRYLNGYTNWYRPEYYRLLA